MPLQRDRLGCLVPSYLLYLRPFFTTGKLVVPNPSRASNPLLTSYFEERDTIELEAVFTTSLDWPAIALGEPGENVGAGRVKVEEQSWQRDFRKLAGHAIGVLVVPSYRSGTKWEIEWLKEQGLLSRCIFVMPPKLEFGGIDIDAEWTRAVEELQHMGLQLPDYDKKGALVRLDASGREEAREPFDLHSFEAVKLSIKSL